MPLLKIPAELGPVFFQDEDALPVGLTFDSFVTPEFRKTKRFNRYVQKTRVALTNWLSSCFPLMLQPQESEPLTAWVILMYIMRYRDFDPIAEEDPQSVKELHAVLTSWCSSLRIPANETYNLRAYLDPEDDTYITEILTDSAERVTQLIDAELVNVCAERIEHQVLFEVNSRISEDNYHLSLPETFEDFADVLLRLTEYVHEDLDRELLNLHVGRISIRLQELAYKHYQEQLRTSEQLNQTLKKTITELVENKKQLTQKVEKLEKQPTTVVKEVNNKGLADLQKKYDRLLDKHNRLKAQIAAEEDVDLNNFSPADLTAPLNYNLRYAFIMDADSVPLMQQKITERFPNAVFLKGENSSISLHPDKFDLVICLNKFVSHSTYYGYKSQCKNRKIPFLNCQYKDLDMIEELIRRYSAT